jgi:hypothetical protein
MLAAAAAAGCSLQHAGHFAAGHAYTASAHPVMPHPMRTHFTTPNRTLQPGARVNQPAVGQAQPLQHDRRHVWLCDDNTPWAHVLQDGGLGPSIDTSRVALWGVSYSGGHVLVTAAKYGSRVKAVIANVSAWRPRTAGAGLLLERLLLCAWRLQLGGLAVVSSCGHRCLPGRPSRAIMVCAFCGPPRVAGGGNNTIPSVPCACTDRPLMWAGPAPLSLPLFRSRTSRPMSSSAMTSSGPSPVWPGCWP